MTFLGDCTAGGPGRQGRQTWDARDSRDAGDAGDARDAGQCPAALRGAILQFWGQKMPFLGGLSWNHLNGLFGAFNSLP